MRNRSLVSSTAAPEDNRREKKGRETAETRVKNPDVNEDVLNFKRPLEIMSIEWYELTAQKHLFASIRIVREERDEAVRRCGVLVDQLKHYKRPNPTLMAKIETMRRT